MEMPFGPVLQVPNVEAAARWLCEELFFTPFEGAGALQHEAVLQNGNCTIYLQKGCGTPPPAPGAGQYYTGFAHVALHTPSIAEALAWCRRRKLSLALKNGHWLFNPKVLGKGEYYFNITAPFGAVFEVSQPVARPGERGPRLIDGLDHVGLPCRNFQQELECLARLGFRPLFSPVENHNEEEGRILCSMLCLGGITAEVYQFLDMEPTAIPPHNVLQGIYIKQKATTPSGTHFVNRGRADG